MAGSKPRTEREKSMLAATSRTMRLGVSFWNFMVSPIDFLRGWARPRNWEARAHRDCVFATPPSTILARETQVGPPHFFVAPSGRLARGAREVRRDRSMRERSWAGIFGLVCRVSQE